MKIFTHTYKITIFKNGKFCWKNQGWVKSDTDGYFLGFTHTFIMFCVIFGLLKLLGI